MIMIKLSLTLFCLTIQSIVLARWPGFKIAQIARSDNLEQYLDAESTRNADPTWRSVLRCLVRADAIRTLPVLNAMLDTDRGKFCCLDGDCDPYDADYPMPIGCGAPISEAWIHAVCLEEVQAKLGTGSIALDVGTGSG